MDLLLRISSISIAEKDGVICGLNAAHTLNTRLLLLKSPNLRSHGGAAHSPQNQHLP